jgi:hypothetical protein
LIYQNKETNMKVKELIVWLQSQDQELDVEVGMNQEYQWELDATDCQVVRYEGSVYVLLGEPAQEWE